MTGCWLAMSARRSFRRNHLFISYVGAKIRKKKAKTAFLLTFYAIIAFFSSKIRIFAAI
jgi:hypothetical protein